MSVQVGDLVKVIAKELRTPIGSVALVTKVQPHTDARGTTMKYYARMVKSGYLFWYRLEHLEVVSEAKA